MQFFSFKLIAPRVFCSMSTDFFYIFSQINSIVQSQHNLNFLIFHPILMHFLLQN